MNAINNPAENDDEMPGEINFSGGMRGKFCRPNLKLNLPVYLDAEVRAYPVDIAAKKGVPLSNIVDDLHKREIGILL